MSLVSCLSRKYIVTVSGAQSGIGKTLLAESLLPLLKNFAAIKITIEDFFTAVTCDDEVIMVPGKDTCRLKRSGAKQVVWVRTPEHNLIESMERACSLLVDCAGVLIEGNSILTYVDPDLAFFIYGGELQALKPSRLYALKKAHVIIHNIRDNSADMTAPEKKLRELNPAATIATINLGNPESVMPFLNQVLQHPRYAKGLPV